MKKFIKSSLLMFTLITAFIINGCDIFEDFQFGLPVSFIIEADGTINPIGSQAYCLTENETYNDYANDINSLTFVGAYFVTQAVEPDTTLEGRVTFILYEYDQGIRGDSLFRFTTPPIKPAIYDSTNAYKIELSNDQISIVNTYLATSSNKCLEGEYSVEITSGAVVNPYIRVRVDALFSIDADLN